MDSIRTQVYNHLKAIFPAVASNDDIARDIVAPEPSVRRATLQLEKANKIYYNSNTSRGRIQWRAQSV